MIIVNLDVMMAKRKIGLLELADLVGITPANLSILKNNKGKAIRFSTLEKLCEPSSMYTLYLVIMACFFDKKCVK